MISWHQYLFGLLFILAGINHFRKPKLYQKLVPPYIPAHSTMVLLSGVAEMVLGFMLMNKNTASEAAIGIIVLLLILLPVHFYMLQNPEVALRLPKWVLILRIPLQFILMVWAAIYI